MESDRQFRQGNDYELYFNPRSYLEAYYSQVEGPVFIQFVVESLHKIYSSGKIEGKTILEIGCGPCIHMIIPAAKHFDEIILSDFSPANLEMQKKWLDQKPDAFDWTQFFEYYCKLAGKGTKREEMENQVRDKVKRVLSCNVHLPNPLSPVLLKDVDAITSSLSLEAASSNIDTYNTAMKNVVTLLKPNGKFILMGVLGNLYYTVGNEKFHSLLLKKQDVLNALDLAGLTLLEMFEDDTPFESDIAPYTGAFVLLAEKKI